MPLGLALAITLGVLAIAVLVVLFRRKDPSGTADSSGAAPQARPAPADVETRIAERTRFWNASDRALLEWLIEKAAADTGVQVARDPVALLRLLEAAEKVRRELEAAAEAEVNLPFLAADAGGPRHFVRKVRRGQWIPS